MGQYHHIVNVSKKMGFSPRAFGSGVQVEALSWDGHPIAALVSLLSGPWKGDKVAVIGDYARNEDFPGAAEAFEVPTLGMVWGMTDQCQVYNFDAFAVKYAPFATKVEGEYKRTVMNTQRPRPLDDDRIVIYNATRNEVITPEGFGDAPERNGVLYHGGKGGMLTAFGALLAASCKGGPRGGGDFEAESPLIGFWVGDDIAIIHPDEVHPDAMNRDADMREVLSVAGLARYTVADDGTVSRFVAWNDAPAGRNDRELGTKNMSKRLARLASAK